MVKLLCLRRADAVPASLTRALQGRVSGRCIPLPRHAELASSSSWHLRSPEVDFLEVNSFRGAGVVTAGIFQAPLKCFPWLPEAVSVPEPRPRRSSAIAQLLPRSLGSREGEGSPGEVAAPQGKGWLPRTLRAGSVDSSKTALVQVGAVPLPGCVTLGK